MAQDVFPSEVALAGAQMSALVPRLERQPSPLACLDRVVAGVSAVQASGHLDAHAICRAAVHDCLLARDHGFPQNGGEPWVSPPAPLAEKAHWDALAKLRMQRQAAQVQIAWLVLLLALPDLRDERVWAQLLERWASQQRAHL